MNRETPIERVKAAYRTIHQQGFLPIFTEDGFDSRRLVEACALAGCKAIEYTLRRRDARVMIPWIRDNDPELSILVGSTLEGTSIVERARLNYPQLLTLDELDSIGVNGFVSMVGLRPETIKRYSSSHVIIAPASTILEAFCAVEAGAHFVKLVGPELNLVRRCRVDAAFDFCPILVTGGMNLERIPEAVEAGTVLIGSGFDVILKEAPHNVSTRHVAELLRRYVETTCQARYRKWPKLAQARDSDFATWLLTLPHHHPFQSHVS
jgi:2-keto-3-deoxy-6-phosphogluconate aldolase